MLVCNVSLRPARTAIAAAIAEAATAVDASTTGFVVFATLVDDPASVVDHVNAYLGEIMVEAASAASSQNAGLVYAAAIAEALTAADVLSGHVPAVLAGAVAESVTANSAQDATLVAAVPTTALVLDGLSPIFVTPHLASVSVLGSGTLLTVQ